MVRASARLFFEKIRRGSAPHPGIFRTKMMVDGRGFALLAFPRGTGGDADDRPR